MGNRPTREEEQICGDSWTSKSSDEDIFDSCAREITVILGWFVTGHLTRLYKLFDGDMVLLIVLGEIAHHNISPFFSINRIGGKSEAYELNLEYAQENLAPCNSLSISESTGIPRETCRRKVQQLLKSGFLEQHPEGGYTISAKVREHYKDFNRETFLRWAKTSRALNIIVNAAHQQNMG